MPIGIICSGEELHNNHHRWPRSAKFSMRWFEFDLGWALLRTLAAVGMAKDIYVKNKRWKPLTPAELAAGLSEPLEEGHDLA
jgi:stearoyl-CoA desaturase (delta-9 desaturase)